MAIESGARCSWRIPAQPSAVILTHTGDILIPAGQEVLRLNPGSGDIQTVAKLAGEPKNNRCNDAKCDPLGNLWIGTMDNSEKDSIGRLWRFNAGGGKSIVLDGIGVANTLAWDVARGHFYFADSMVGDIYVFDYDAASAEIGNRKVFFQRDRAPGVPDGSARGLAATSKSADPTSGLLPLAEPQALHRASFALGCRGKVPGGHRQDRVSRGLGNEVTSWAPQGRSRNPQSFRIIARFGVGFDSRRPWRSASA